MMHFVRAFSIMRAYGVIRLTVIEDVQNYKKNLLLTSKTFLKMAGKRMHTPRPISWIRTWPYATETIKRVSHRGAWHNAALPPFNTLLILLLVILTPGPDGG